MTEEDARSGRRQFLWALGGGVVLAGAGARLQSAAGGALPLKPGTANPRVVVVKAKHPLTSGYDADRSVLRAMLERGLCALSGEKDSLRALARYIRSSDRVGYKINGLAGRNAATHVELVDELSVLVTKIGVEPRRQIAFDRLARDLEASQFRSRGDGAYACVGNDDAGHEEAIVTMPSTASRLCKVLTRKVDAVINLPVLKQHMLAGMTGALKNNFGCIHNPSKMHLDGCDPYVAEVNALPAIREKQRLVIMDALRPVIHGGPSFHAAMAMPARCLLFATDPVAMDTIGLSILEKLRSERGLPSLTQAKMPATYLGTAERMGLGSSQGIDLLAVEV